jgi:hypothetical protein
MRRRRTPARELASPGGDAAMHHFGWRDECRPIAEACSTIEKHNTAAWSPSTTCCWILPAERRVSLIHLGP